ncbi:MAG: AmmeMemoRadiSam system protein B [Gammaproteobacteria bacterium]|nr:AmmeMemoRadiSam system protein B [Gammaproteobacteria bacterium]
MTSCRMPAVAGVFYPEDATELRQQVQRYLSQATPPPCSPKALIVPHAGYVYSGAVAASAYASLATIADQIHRIALFGPAHRVALRGLAISAASAFETPLGSVPVDAEMRDQLRRFPQVQVSDDPHRLEHSLEVQLPFLQMLLKQFTLVPLVVGDATAEEVCSVMDYLWQQPGTLIVVSSDLSHYHNYQHARQLDQQTSDAIEQLQPDSISYEQACGRNPVNGLLLLAQQRQLQATTVDLRNSGDTAGSRDRVVGYGAYIFH